VRGLGRGGRGNGAAGGAGAKWALWLDTVVLAHFLQGKWAGKNKGFSDVSRPYAVDTCQHGGRREAPGRENHPGVLVAGTDYNKFAISFGSFAACPAPIARIFDWFCCEQSAAR
jgi:hypothetical protein